MPQSALLLLLPQPPQGSPVRQAPAATSDSALPQLNAEEAAEAAERRGQVPEPGPRGSRQPTQRRSESARKTAPAARTNPFH